MKQHLTALREINSLLNRQEMILWLNKKDVDYTNWTELEMIIYYIENSGLSREEMIEKIQNYVDNRFNKSVNISLGLYNDPAEVRQIDKVTLENVVVGYYEYDRWYKEEILTYDKLSDEVVKKLYDLLID